jgi:polysaccharide biosynthesis transport protein
MTAQATDGLSLRAYLRVIARWKWPVIAVTLLITVAGTAYTWTRTPMYTATTQLLYVKQIDIANPLAQSFIDTTAQQAEIESAPAVIASSQVRADAEKLMKSASVSAGYSVSVALQPGVNNNYSNVVGVSAVSADSETAADAANAYAEAFIAWGRDSARAQVGDAIDVVKGQLTALADTGVQQGSEYKSLQQSLQQLELLQASDSGSFKSITAASPPSAPFAPDKRRGISLAFAAGLVLGMGLAFLLEQFDTRVHGDEQIADLLDLPVIGHLPPLGRKNRDKGVLQTLSDPSGASAEAFRVLRSNLDFVSIDGDLKTLLVASSVQGEGKSTTACNLAVSMALMGKRVILVDADLRSPRVHTYMGVPNSVGVSSVMARRVDVAQAVIPVVLNASPDHHGSLVLSADVATGSVVRRGGGGAGLENGAGGTPAQSGSWKWPDGTVEAPVLRVLPSGPLPPNPGEMIASRRFGEILAELSSEADLVIVDAPAMLPVGDVAAVAPWVDAMVYVVNATKVRRPALRQARMQLAHLPCRKLGLVEVVDTKGQGYHGGYYSHTPEGGRNGRRRRD